MQCKLSARCGGGDAISWMQPTAINERQQSRSTLNLDALLRNLFHPFNLASRRASTPPLAQSPLLMSLVDSRIVRLRWGEWLTAETAARPHTAVRLVSGIGCQFWSALSALLRE